MVEAHEEMFPEEEEVLYGSKWSSYSVVDLHGFGFQIVPDAKVDEFLRNANAGIEGEAGEAKVISSGQSYRDAKNKFDGLKRG